MEMIQIGATELEALYEGSGSGPTPGATPVHAVYAITLSPDEGFPSGMSYASIVIRVDDGSIRVVSPDGKSTVSVGTGGGIAGDDGTVVLASGTVRLEAEEAATLGVGNAVFSTNEALEVTARSEGATVIVSVVISASDTITEHCWICPTSG